MKTGIGAKTRLTAENKLNPQPQPNRSTRGAVANGKNVLIKHLVTMTPVIADADRIPNASTT